MNRPIFCSRRCIGLGALLLVGLMCVWLTWERNVVMARRAARQLLEERGVEIKAGTGAATLSWVRRLFGDESIQSLDIALQSVQTDVEEAAAQFPEAEVWDERGGPGSIDLTGPPDDSAGDLFED